MLFVISPPSAFAASPARAEAAAGDDLAILTAADEARGNLRGVTWEVTVETAEGSRPVTMSFAVQAREFDFLATTLAPPRSRGNRLLMRRGSMWFAKPDLSRPVPISQRQKLLGNAAYGDIAATNYAKDYEVVSRVEEDLDGEPCHRFDLRATAKQATYDRIRYWISVARRVGVRAEYSTRSGKLLKAAFMVYDQSVPGPDGSQKPFVSRIEIRDAILGGKATVLTFSHPVLREVPPDVFDVNLLTR